MKLQILSDLHIDSYSKRDLPTGEIPQTEADIILVAGDTSNSDMGMRWLASESARLGKPIATIAGNHEYFGEDILKFDRRLATHDSYDDSHQQGLKVLQCQSLDFSTADDEVRILGCTFWTDYQYQADDSTIDSAMSFMRDYRDIRAGQGSFTPQLSMEIHAKHRAWLQQALVQAYDEGKKVVVMTHHSISPRSVAEKYAHFSSNSAFVSDMSAWMNQHWSPTLWIHGHTHEAFDYQQDKTRVVVNPRAYPSEVSSTGLAFAWDKVVEI
ncbi:MAG: metallophosphoesterase [Pseudomonadales bacterium]|nr:MAG: metallophosphoesterase [Pseudomonadales bacterium]